VPLRGTNWREFWQNPEEANSLIHAGSQSGEKVSAARRQPPLDRTARARFLDLTERGA
jgi:hypothetical protein